MERIKGGFPDNCERSAIEFAIRSYPGLISEDPSRGERGIYVLPMIFSRVMLSKGTGALLSDQDRRDISARTGAVVISANNYHQ